MQENNFTYSKHSRTDDEGSSSGNGLISLFPVVAIGASTGGLDAVEQLLDHLSPDLGMAFVIIVYLPPGETNVRERLQKRTTMKVAEARNNMPLDMNKVYILPVDSYLSIGIGRFVHLPVFRPEKSYHIIDHFFTTLAGIYKNNAFAVVLSGTGADGTAGVRAIRIEGGITFAQDDTATFRGMPQYAIGSGFVDFVLSPEGIADRLRALKNYSFRNGAILRHLESNKVQLGRIHLLLADKYGVDFSLYKQSSVHRRIIRRMTLNRIPNVEMYVKHLEADPGEIDLLYKDLLSGAGGFFREPVLGRILIKKIFPFILKDRKPDDPVRIWIPACSGGEEAYSMVIYLLEYMRSKDIQVPVRVFATDLNDAMIEMARAGVYTRSAVRHIAPIRLKKFFVKLEGGYQVVKAVRDMCIFARHDFLKDPPYARMDIISCQHALLSLEQVAREKALKAFHYSLKQTGFLLLDRADGINWLSPFFQRAYKEWNVYTKISQIRSLSFDSPNVGLQAAYEELLSVNRELQSINEDQATAREDLESLNEELLMINGEMTRRIAALEGAVQNAEAILETIRKPLIDLYSDLRVRKANKAFYTFFQLSGDEVEENYLYEIANGVLNIPGLIDSLRRTISKRLPFEDMEVKCNIPATGERLIFLNATRINGLPGKRARILLTMEDITEKRLSEKQKDEFISVASHELKIPATGIQAYARILYNEFVEANDQRSAQLVSKLNNQATRLANLTGDLLDMTRITQGQLGVKESFFDVRAMVAGIVEEMQRTTQLRLVFSPGSAATKFWGDRERLGQVVQNLVSNAIKYSPCDKQVIISLDMQDKDLLISVQDFGIGMTPGTQEKIFDRFFRVDSSAQDHPGLGLGLYISHEIVRRHGGSIAVQSEKDNGSTFTVILPVRKDLSSMA